MASSPKLQDTTHFIPHYHLLSPTTTATATIHPPLPSPISRSDPNNPYPTTFVQADTSSFKQVVQMLTGSPRTTTPTTVPDQFYNKPGPSLSQSHNIPPIKSIPNKKNHSSGFKLYERRNSLQNFKINPLNPVFGSTNSGFSPRNKPEILSPSLLDFPSLTLSPVTPLIPDPFDRSNRNGNNNNDGTVNGNSMDTDAEEKAIKEKGFYLHPSPSTTPREMEPRLLPLFPVTSPRVSGSSNDSS